MLSEANIDNKGKTKCQRKIWKFQRKNLKIPEENLNLVRKKFLDLHMVGKIDNTKMTTRDITLI